MLTNKEIYVIVKKINILMRDDIGCMYKIPDSRNKLCGSSNLKMKSFRLTLYFILFTLKSFDRICPESERIENRIVI